MSDGSARSCVMLVGVWVWGGVDMSAWGPAVEQGTTTCCSAVVLRQRAMGACTYLVTSRIQRAAIDHWNNSEEEWLWHPIQLAVTVQISEKHGSAPRKTKTKS